MKLSFLIIGVILLFGFFGCLGGEKESSTNGNGTVDSDTTDSGSNLEEQTQEPAIQKSSLDNLNEKYASNEISKEDYIFYSLQALYEPSSLPSEYSGEQVVGYDISDEIMLAIENWDSLSPEYQSKISEWIALPEISDAEPVLLSGKASFSGGGTKTYKLEAIIRG